MLASVRRMRVQSSVPQKRGKEGERKGGREVEREKGRRKKIPNPCGNLVGFCVRS